MNRDDIITLAQEAVLAYPNDNPFDFRLGRIEAIEHFAALVAAQEREACAKVAEEATSAWTKYEFNRGCMYCAKAIRARGEA